MTTRYFKRYRMELDFRQTDIPRAKLPPGYAWGAWSARLLRQHAAVKCASFRQEMDRHLFPALGSVPGCEDLMRSIASHPGFLPQSTWLMTFTGNDFTGPLPCGTVQGLYHSTTLGSIQNVGIVPEHRGFGLGRSLVLKALRGFRAYGLCRVYLDVTADNLPAVDLYRSVGFRCISTTYRELPVPIEMAATSTVIPHE